MNEKAEKLLKLLEDNGRDSRDAIIALREAVSEEDAEVRRAAAFGLGEVGDEEEVALLGRFAADEAEEVRSEAACALGKIGSFKAAKALTGFCRDPKADVRVCAVFALGDVLDASEGAARTSISSAVSGAGLERLLEDKDRDVKVGAAIIFGFLRDARCRDILVEALWDRKWQFDAARALASLGDAAAIEPLRRLAGKFFVHPLVRLEALRSLFLLGQMEAGKEIAAKTGSRRLEERGYALTLMGELRLEGAFEKLEAVLRDGKDFHRHIAARALGLSGDRCAVEVLLAALGDDDAELRQDAARALGTIGDTRAVGRLREVAKSDGDEVVRNAANEALEALNSGG